MLMERCSTRVCKSSTVSVDGVEKVDKHRDEVWSVCNWIRVVGCVVT